MDDRPVEDSVLCEIVSFWGDDAGTLHPIDLEQ